MRGFDHSMCPNILIVDHTRTGNTERLAQAVAEGTQKVPGINIELKEVESTTPDEVSIADGCAFGSPTHFSTMSGKIQDLLTELYIIRHNLSEKPMAAFTTGSGGQGTALEDMEKILKNITSELVRSGIAIEGAPSQIDKSHANNLGETLAKQVIRKFVDI